ncbi:beta-1,4-galactosyltransferase 7-like [Acanthaster planci]|uniref:Beta-1,4-galactosyltransferase n=1 Tax=Acanthaster planci TaxID=133434 RepID=A0A8B7YTK9_ACAPL|nr:beta-1,4-galactosyltransferase 7-like [Acanthaster planci]XP_022096629.1 beta-1,4-galactosyltransferase 7-like [Acanthaster planci]XP_022096630.1 beta-1,4-galactosyltransferase 7-like [Acanthaster planci]
MACYRLLTPVRLVLAILTVCLTSFIFFSLNDDCTCTSIDILLQRIRNLQEELRTKDEALSNCRGSKGNEEETSEGEAGWDPHVLCIYVPHRDRFEELMEFVPYMDKFLSQQMVRHRIVVINQIDTHRFNRASLLNIGFKETRDRCSYIALHDVDLLPRNPAITYHYANVQDGPYHVSAPDLHPKYDYKEFIGGIMLMTTKQFEQLNGLSNRFWGWGREDDEFYMRIQEAQMKIFRPQGITTGRKTFFHIHDKKRRKRDMKRIGDQHRESFKRDRQTGLHNVQYSVRSQQELSINGAKATLLHVKIDCDAEVTPWCDIA